jgi:signal transduction histidine kinase/CheY-like chemotaxis protein/tetratricopeptide (TPR) repeat protein
VGALVRIPGVEIGEELGHGAYSIVFRARQGDTRCALKVPHARGRWTRWVYREAVALARVKHPGLPRVLEVGEADGLPYILMELVEGETLADRLRRGPLAPDLALDLACQLADALRAVHEVGLVHRDVKPRNVILEAGNRARLVDFGFAAPVGSLGARDTAGTRRYSAPEQFRSPDRVDARADLYALGRVLFECLTGRPCGDADATSVVVDLVAAGISPSAARIVHGLVAEAPDDRYPDSLALLGELHRVRAGGAPRGAAACEPARLAGTLVGRDGEVDRFTRAWRIVGASGGGVLFVEGIRGTGKTRFLRACTARVREEGRGRCLESVCREQDGPLSVFRSLFEGYFASLSRLPPQERAAARNALATAASGPLASLACVIAPGFSEILGAGEPPVGVVPEAFAEGVSEIVVRLARLSGPLLLCIDDLQWIDPLSGDVLAAIADRAHEAPLLLVLAARPAQAGGTFERFDSVGPTRSTRINLGPFDVRQSAALIGAHLGVATPEPALVRRIVATADDTPVGILEVLGAFLDAGALRLRSHVWELDPASVERVALPSGALAHLGTRIQELPAATRRVFEVAAILGTRFDDALLAKVLELDAEDVGYALADGRRAGLLEPTESDGHMFTHDSVRELLTDGLDEGSRQKWHQRAAERIAEGVDTHPELLYACANHFAAAPIEANPVAAYWAARRAGEGALERFDDETALRFFDMARARAEAARLPLDIAFHRKVGEASLRVGALDESLRSFEAALELAVDPVGRAGVLGRLTWLRRARSEPDEAWAALERAFGELGVVMPTEESPPSAGGRKIIPAGGTPDAFEALYELYQHHARLGVECGKPSRTLQSTMALLTLAGDKGASIPLVRAHATYGAALHFAGRKAAARRHLGIASEMARKVADPSATAYYLVRRFVAFTYEGQFDAALTHLRECADGYGPWIEVNEFCDIVASGDVIESVRGRATESWSWISRAIDRLRRRARTSAVLASHVLYRARAALASLGRSGQEGPWLLAQLESAASKLEKAYYRMACWGPRVRYLLDTASLGPAFEDLVVSFQSEGYNPAASHPALVEYYVAVAHARMHQCLRCSADERPARVAALRAAAADLRGASKNPLALSHSALADAYVVWFEGHPGKADGLLAKAESLARRETCPWVLWGVSRARAHMLREQGKPDAARDQAHIAEVLARENGAEPRARWVREEFSLPAPQVVRHSGSTASSHRSSQRARRQLASLLHIVRAPYGQLRGSQQSAAIVDDLVRELAAVRAFLLFEPTEDPRAHLLLGRSRLGETLQAPTGWRRTLMRAVMDRADPDSGDARAEPMTEGAPDRKRLLVVPLFLQEHTVGAICVERASSDPAFHADDQELLLLLAHQLPLGLELSRLLEERDQLQSSLQQVQKMDVVGLLAGGVAHDVNNMLQGILSGLQGLQEGTLRDEDDRANMQLIEDGLTRATRLTQKLLSFSRQQPLTLASRDLNLAIKGLEPMIRRLTSRTHKVAVVLDLDAATSSAVTDESGLDQAIMNLVINARDAMHGRGVLTISTRNAVLDADAVRRGAPSEGDYALVEVADDGEGMSPEVVSRIFDPFFTTKDVGKGTGLGLTMVYAFVRQCGGFIEVASEVGKGTTFRLYLRRGEPIQLERPKRLSSLPVPSTVPQMILVVDDDPNIRELTRMVLQDGGYQVMTASGSAEALRLMQSNEHEVALVILDLSMPEMSGEELERRLAALHVPAKVLFVSGHDPSALSEGTELVAHAMLQKPFTRSGLLGRVRRLLNG